MINRYSKNRFALEGNNTSSKKPASLAGYTAPQEAKSQVDSWLANLSPAERAEAMKLMKKYSYT